MYHPHLQPQPEHNLNLWKVAPKPKQYTIYKITNTIDGLSYIGMTSRYFSRIKEHITGRSSAVYYLREHVTKHGLDSFEFKILERTTCKELAHKYEREYIIQHNCIYPNGYNINK
jgi:predicted GIY-YIG superfamily endonuclease